MKRVCAGASLSRIAGILLGSVTLLMANCNPITGFTAVLDLDGQANVDTLIGLPSPTINVELPPLPEP